MITDQRFRKSERLCRKTLIEELFKNGSSFFSYPFRIVWLPVDELDSQPAQLAISVQKRLFKRAVHRNLLKRRIRESYRKNKSGFYVELKRQDVNVAFFLIYTASTILSYKEIEQKIIIALSRLMEEIAGSYDKRT